MLEVQNGDCDRPEEEEPLGKCRFESQKQEVIVGAMREDLFLSNYAIKIMIP